LTIKFKNGIIKEKLVIFIKFLFMKEALLNNYSGKETPPKNLKQEERAEEEKEISSSQSESISGNPEEENKFSNFLNVIQRFNLRKKLLTDKYFNEAEAEIKKEIGENPSQDFIKAAINEVIAHFYYNADYPLQSSPDVKILEILEKYLEDKEYTDNKIRELNYLMAKRSPEDAKKRKEIQEFLEGYNNKEESIFKLSPDERYFTDPRGVDPVKLLPVEFKHKFLGKFIRQEFDQYSLPSLSVDNPTVYFSTPPTVLRYQKGSVSVSQNIPFGLDTKVIIEKNKVIEINLRDRYLDGIDIEKFTNQALFNDLSLRKYPPRFPFGEPDKYRNIEIYHRGWLYFDESNFTEKKLLHVKIKSLDVSQDKLWKFVILGDKRFINDFIQGLTQEEQKKLQSLIEVWWDREGLLSRPTLKAFLQDPYFTLFKGYSWVSQYKNEEEREKQLIEDQKIFLVKWNKIWNLIQEYKEKELKGEKSEKMPFLPFPGEAAPSIPGLAIEILDNTLNEARKKGYEGISSDPSYFHVAENLKRMGFQFDNKKDEEIFLKIQSSLNALEITRWKNYLAEETNRLLKDYQKKGLKKSQAKEMAYLEAREKAQNVLLTPQERSWIVLLNSLKDKDLIPEELKLYERDEKGEKKLDQEGKPIYLSWPTRPRRYVWMTLPTKKEEEETKEIESAEKIGDRLIADYVITGYTLTREKHYLDRILNQQIKKPTVIYHMYARDSVIETPEGERKPTANKKHLKKVKEAISRLGAKVTEEKGILGNVKNPGPNRPFGWHKDPESWVKNGIEKSWQRVLIITCKDKEELEKVLSFLNKKCWQENAEAIEGSWLIPDIRIFNVDPNNLSKEFQENFKEAILHIKSGKDGKISTLTTKSHRSLGDYERFPVLIHRAMKEFIRRNELKNGAYEIYSR